MKTAIVYLSSHGTTKNIAKIIAEKLEGQVDLINLKDQSKLDISAFDQIIIGASIHVGTIHKKSKKFCENNHKLLLKKKLGIFVCCAEKNEKAQEQFNNSFAKDLRNHSSSIGLLGFEFNFPKMNFIEKIIIKKMIGSEENVSQIDYLAIDRFIDEFQDKSSALKML